MEGLLESGLGFGWGAALLLLSVILFGAGSPRGQSRRSASARKRDSEVVPVTASVTREVRDRTGQTRFVSCAKSDIGIPRGTSFVQRALQAYYPKAGKTLGCELPRPARTRRMSMRLRIKDKKKVPRGTGIPTENKGNNTTYILDQKEGDVKWKN